MHTSLRPIAFSLLVALSTSGCAAWSHATKWAAIKPYSSPSETQTPQAERDYAGAVAAISRKDYVRALDLLQAARHSAPDDVRILNGFGVVYDKLGRFDLSARYYGRAQALDAGSQIVASNLAYSKTLQASAALAPLQDIAPAPVVLASREALVEPVVLRQPPAVSLASSPPVSPASSPVVVRLARPAAVMARGGPVLTGRPLYIADATGRSGSAAPIRAELARLGWSAPRFVALGGPGRATTTIRYPASTALAAQALARTLPRKVQMVDCGRSCAGVELILGADSLAWPSRFGVHGRS